MKSRRPTHQLIGLYKNGRSDYRPEGCPALVNVHDFVDKELCKAVPYGVYDIANDRRTARGVARVPRDLQHDVADREARVPFTGRVP